MSLKYHKPQFHPCYAVLALLLLGLILTFPSASAKKQSVLEVNATAPETISLSLNSGEARADTVTIRLKNNDFSESSATVTATTNARAGLTISASTTVLDGSKYMQNTTSMGDVLAPVLAGASASKASFGTRLIDETGDIVTGDCLSTCTTTGTWGLAFGDGNYNPIADLSDPAQVASSNTNGTVTETVRIGVATLPNQLAGTYTASILFTAVAKEVSTNDLTAAFNYYYGSSAKKSRTGDSETYYTMQQMNTLVCSLSGTDEVGLQLMDERDEKLYWVAKLQDGSCWMTQNLDLDLTTAGLDSRLSDIGYESYIPSSDDADSPENNDTISYWNASSDYAPLVTLTTAATTTSTTDSETGDTVTTTTVSTFDPSELKYGTYSYDPGDLYSPDGNAATLVDAATYGSDLNTHYQIGNYYQANAATAGSLYYSNGTQDIILRNANLNDQTSTVEAADSICARGWRLPRSGIASASENRSGSYGLLINTYNEYGDSTGVYSSSSNDSYTDVSAKYRAAPFYFTQAGYFNSTTWTNLGTEGFYISSTPSASESYYYVLRIHANQGVISHENAYATNRGSSVRCVAR